MAYKLFSPTEYIGRSGADAPESGAQLWFTQTANNTPVTVYADKNGGSTRTNPVVANASGEFPSIWLNDNNATRVRKYAPSATAGVDAADWDYDGIIQVAASAGLDTTGSNWAGSASDNATFLDSIDGQMRTVFQTRSEASAADIHANITTIIVHRYSANQPPHGAVYKEVTDSGTLTADQFRTNTNSRRWQYVPSPMGYDARAFGWVGDGTTDDTDAAQRVLSVFGYKTASVTGEIMFPGVGVISRPLVIPGGNGGAVKLKGDSAHNRAGAIGSGFKWNGSGYKSHIIFYGCNQGGIENLVVSGGTSALTSNGLVNQIHLTADNFISTTLAASVTAGTSKTVAVADATDFAVGTAVGIGGNNSTFEVAYVAAVSGTDITFDKLQFAHSSGEQVGGSQGSSGLAVKNLAITAPAGSATAGILIGNVSAAETPQVSELAFDHVSVTGISNPGDAYSGFRIIEGGNVKNYRFHRCTVTGTDYAIAGELVSSCLDIDNLTTANITVAVVLCNGANVIMNSVQFEGTAKLLVGSNGANATVANLTSCSYEAAAPNTDDIVIDWSGSLNMFGCVLNNGRTGSSVPKIKISGISTFATAATEPASLQMFGCYLHNATSLADILLDGSSNAIGFSDFSVARRLRLTSLGNFSNTNSFPNLTGHLSCSNASLSNEGLSTGVTYSAIGEVNQTYLKAVVPYTAVQTASTIKDIVFGNIPARSKIVSAVIDVTATFGGTAGTVSAKLGTATDGNDLLLSCDIKSATAQFGLVDGDLGTGLARATAVNGGAWVWGAGSPLSMRITSGSGNLSGLTSGSLSVYLTLQRLG